MLRRKILVLIGISIVSVALYAQNVVLEYSEGKVEYQKGSAWTAFNIGDSIALASSVRVSGGGLAELRSGTVALHIDRDGQYQLSALFSKAQQGQQSSLGSIVSNKVNSLVAGGKTGVQTSVGGVRGSAATDNSVQWADNDDPSDSATDPIAEVEALIAKPDLNTALNKIDAVIKSNSKDIAYARFLRAEILVGQGRSAAAARELGNANISKGQAHYMESVMLYASVSLDLQDWDKTISLTTDALTLKPETEINQSLTLAQALAYRGKSQTAKARELLQSVVAAGAGTAAGKEASRLLAN